MANIIPVLLLLFCVYFAYGDLPTEKCPQGCVCVKRDVKCYALTDFPTSFPPMTTYIYMDELNIQSIPPDSFHGLGFLNTIEFHRTNFGALPTCAFKSIPSLEKLIFVKTVIGRVEPFAIFNNTGPLSIDFTQSKITEMHSFGIMTLPNMVALNIKETTIYDMKTRSIVNITSGKIDISGSTFKKIQKNPIIDSKFDRVEVVDNIFEILPCAAFDGVISSTSEKPQTSGNGVLCDCGISYIKQLTTPQQQKTLLPTYCVENGEINVNKTVEEALKMALPCDQRSKEESTKCGQDTPIPIPMIKCPSHSHGHGDYIPNTNDHKHGNSGAFNGVNHLTLLSFLFVCFLLKLR